MVCPNCNKETVTIRRETINLDKTSSTIKFKNSPIKVRKGNTGVEHKTIGVCKNCGYTFEITQNNNTPKKKKTPLIITIIVAIVVIGLVKSCFKSPDPIQPVAEEPAIEEEVVEIEPGTMICYIFNDIIEDNNIGDELKYSYIINDEPYSFGKEYHFQIGDTISYIIEITEQDSNPDVGKASGTYTITEEDYNNGFDIIDKVTVTENGGKNKGLSKVFEVTLAFQIK